MSKRPEDYGEFIEKDIVTIPMPCGGTLDLLIREDMKPGEFRIISENEFNEWAREHLEKCLETKMKQSEETRQRLCADWKKFEENNNGQ
jgi:hypothetical protein